MGRAGYVIFAWAIFPRTAGPSSGACACDVAPMGAAVLGTAVRWQPAPSRGICAPTRHAGARRGGGEKKVLVIIPQILYAELMHMADETICLQAYRKSDARQDLFWQSRVLIVR